MNRKNIQTLSIMVRHRARHIQMLRGEIPMLLLAAERMAHQVIYHHTDNEFHKIFIMEMTENIYSNFSLSKRMFGPDIIQYVLTIHTAMGLDLSLTETSKKYFEI